MKWLKVQSKMVELLEESVLFTGFITIVVVSTGCYLWITQGKIPPELLNLVYVIVTAFFGAKAQKIINKAGKE